MYTQQNQTQQRTDNNKPTDRPQVDWQEVKVFEDPSGIFVRVMMLPLKAPRFQWLIGWKDATTQKTFPRIKPDVAVERQTGVVKLKSQTAIVTRLLAEAEGFIYARTEKAEQDFQAARVAQQRFREHVQAKAPRVDDKELAKRKRHQDNLNRRRDEQRSAKSSRK